MLATRVTSGAICLRCRLRLLHRSAQPFQASSRITRTQHPTLRRFYGDSTSRSLDNDFAPEDEDVDSKYENEARGRRREHGARHGIKTKTLTLHKKRLSRDRVLEEASGILGTDMLGKPASVIIMKDKGLRRKKYNPSAPDESDDKPDNRPANLEALLDLQRETPTAEEVHDNIHSLKPKSYNTMPERDFRKLQAELMDGFLSNQLHDYLKDHKQDGRSPKFDDLANTTSIKLKRYSWIREISPWVPLNPHSDPVEGGNISLHGYATESTTLKEELALRIMRECWGLSIAELDAGLGEINIKIRNATFLLLMRGTRRWVAFMDHISLDPGEKIEAFRNRKTIRIVATKTKALTIVQGLSKMIKHIAEANYPADFISSEPLDEAVLEEVGRITNTYVRLNQITRHLIVTWMESEEHTSEGPIGLRSPGDEVFRLLLTAFKPQPATTATLLAADLESQATGRFVMNTANKEKLGWNDRTGVWARYILPVASEDSDLEVMEQLDRLDRLRLPIVPQPELPTSNELDIPESDVLLSPYDSVEWTKESQVSTVAQFGSLLHANNPSGSPPSLPDLLTANHPRVFAAATPHAIQLTKFNNATQSPVKTRTSVLIRFWPTPYFEPTRNEDYIKKKRKGKPRAPRVATPPAPLLELRLAVSGNEIKGIESFRAIKQTQVTDVMLPASLVDLRFTQAQYAVPEDELSEMASWEPLNKFLRASQFDLERGELKTPPKQSFFVRWYPTMQPFSGDTESGTPRNLDTEYTLASLEIHRSISMPYEGFKLSYTYIEAGPESERRAEVTLEPETSAGLSKTDMRTYHDRFLAACQKLASTDELWSGLHSM
ncbi:mitochondrial inner-membrane-bound regulator-domain-containing protein [Daldinia vernicosa]|uniref:mitochondrial inner-membrane-bound regulator-domain-containing protein n=1 Tax=Daldinia vernicosa TaxID=114800 RepID=UPI002007B90D|nr:mitochondrial inner-membrane-bound regulator-domain-containing protein [Daldinia vernicosa]KAI0848228.1 mitochondrial inner-membrane-bound regulator-domain-containing protein [Daldinia vernicosa]